MGIFKAGKGQIKVLTIEWNIAANTDVWWTGLKRGGCFFLPARPQWCGRAHGWSTGRWPEGCRSSCGPLHTPFQQADRLHLESITSSSFMSYCSNHFTWALLFPVPVLMRVITTHWSKQRPWHVISQAPWILLHILRTDTELLRMLAPPSHNKRSYTLHSATCSSYTSQRR